MDKNLIIEAETKNGYIAYYKNDGAFVNSLKNNVIFETDLVMQNIQDIVLNAKIVIDGGAHAGSHTILYKKINPDLTIHSFEPQSRMFDLLSHNVMKNKLDKVFLYNLALANKATKVNMATSVTDLYYDENREYVKKENGEYLEAVFTNISYGDENPFNLGGLGFGDGGEEVSTTTIDSLELAGCDFIKLDIEGAEILALYGAVDTINRYRPKILFEYNHHQLSDRYFNMFALNKETPFEFLEKLGYQIKEIEADNYLASPQ